MLYEKTNELYHHGVKGQKWGVRKQIDVLNVKNTYQQRADKIKGAINRTNKTPKVMSKITKEYPKKITKGIHKTATTIGKDATKVSLSSLGGIAIGSLAGGPLGGMIGAASGMVKGILKIKLRNEKNKANKEIKNAKIAYKKTKK